MTRRPRPRPARCRLIDPTGINIVKSEQDSVTFIRLQDLFNTPSEEPSHLLEEIVHCCNAVQHREEGICWKEQSTRATSIPTIIIGMQAPSFLKNNLGGIQFLRKRGGMRVGPNFALIIRDTGVGGCGKYCC